jgi:L-aminopeptidase/D-esterase-like protein
MAAGTIGTTLPGGPAGTPRPASASLAITPSAAASPNALGVVGAGTGAVAGGLKGGVGMASVVLESGTVAALAVVNALGSVLHPATGTLYGAAFGLPGEFDWLVPPTPADLAAGAEFLRPPARLPVRPFNTLNTAIGVVATDVPLTAAQCAKLAGIGHDGLARAVGLAHSMFDGDTIFGLCTGAAEDSGPASPRVFHRIWPQRPTASPARSCTACCRSRR